MLCAHLWMLLTVIDWAAQIATLSKAAEQYHKRVRIPFLLAQHFACLAVCGSRYAVPETGLPEVMQQGLQLGATER